MPFYGRQQKSEERVPISAISEKQRAQRKEWQRRSLLYGTSLSRSLPKTSTNGSTSDKNVEYLKQGRPPLSNVVAMRGEIYTTAAVDRSNRKLKHEWRVGYKNKANTYKVAASKDGLLQPMEGSKSRMLQDAEFKRATEMYPPELDERVEEWTPPCHAVPATSAHTKNTPKEWWPEHESNNSASQVWKPPRSPTKGMEGTFDYKLSNRVPKTNAFPANGYMEQLPKVKKVSFSKRKEGIPQQTSTLDVRGRVKQNGANRIPLRKAAVPHKKQPQVDARYMTKKQKQIEATERMLKSASKAQTSSVQNPVICRDYARAYHLGIENMNDDELPTGYIQQAAYGTSRPMTAGVSDPRKKLVAKVAGALRRPKSANISCFGNATVSVMAAKSVVELEHDANKMQLEIEKRKSMWVSVTKEVNEHKELARHKVSDIFIELLAFALENVPKYMQKALENVKWTEYLTREKVILNGKNKRISFTMVEPTTFDGIPCTDQGTMVLKGCPDLYLERTQLVNGLRKYAVAEKMANRFFSVLDDTLSNRIQLEQVCLVLMRLRVRRQTLVFGNGPRPDSDVKMLELDL